MSEPLDASRVCSGTYGKIYLDGKWHSETSECTADVETDMKEILTAGSEWTGYKPGAKKGSGTLKGWKVTSEMIKRGFSKFEILSELDDPEAYGYERIRLKNCRATKINLINIKPGELVEEETPFVFTDYELVDAITAD
ncbi:phage tail tube protein [Clostridium butyricum]|jgi:DMSO/TMAO reductase YedYZ molybdopterin-dependent catalytic subunit|uniref:phage tail tube protein n=1 Tax=Clostridium butyricum TaxID=1492 RepID=UPI00374F9307